MRFSIVFDDNGTILAASLAGEEVNKMASGPGENATEVDLLDDMAEAELKESAERLFLNMDTKKLAQQSEG
jgi:hypothetical protein